MFSTIDSEDRTSEHKFARNLLRISPIHGGKMPTTLLNPSVRGVGVPNLLNALNALNVVNNTAQNSKQGEGSLQPKCETGGYVSKFPIRATQRRIPAPNVPQTLPVSHQPVHNLHAIYINPQNPRPINNNHPNNNLPQDNIYYNKHLIKQDSDYSDGTQGNPQSSSIKSEQMRYIYIYIYIEFRIVWGKGDKQQEEMPKVRA